MRLFKLIVLLAVGGWSLAAGARSQNVFLEAEQFADLGGWDLDQQAMERQR